MDLTRFERAGKFFGDLEQKVKCGKGAVPPQGADEHFNTAAYAAAVLYSLGKERLLELEKQNIVHGSTISGGSLTSAIMNINRYLLGNEILFDTDNYEQLYRTCHSAKAFLKQCNGDYMPRLG